MFPRGQRRFLIFIGLVGLLEICFQAISVSRPKVPLKTQKVVLKHNSQLSLSRLIDQIAVASRLVRSAVDRNALSGILESLQSVNDGYNKTVLAGFKNDFTIVINCRDECIPSKIQSVLLSLSKSDYSKQPIIVATSKTDDSEIKGPFPQLPNLKIINAESSKNVISTYRMILEHVETKAVFITKAITWFPTSSDLRSLFEQISGGQSDVVGATYFAEESSKWEVGCFKMKKLVSRFKIIKGYDRIYHGQSTMCQHITGPFMINREALQHYLKDSASFTDKIEVPLFYLDLFHHLQNSKRKVQLSFRVIFGLQLNGDELDRMNRGQIKVFARKNYMSRVQLGNGVEFRYSCNEANINGGGGIGRAGFFAPKCTIDDLDRLLVHTAKVCHEKGFEYELDTGTVIGQAKMSASLPWERDHDIVFRSKQFKALAALSRRFSSDNLKLAPQFNGIDKCLANGNRNCVYMGIGSQYWRMELWGQNVLTSDVYRDDALAQALVAKEPTLTNLTRIRGNPTLGQINDDWLLTVCNPGNYMRSKYGLDALKHQQHWMDIGAATSWVPYKGGKWRACPKPGEQSCSDNFLADGNIIFKNVWL